MDTCPIYGAFLNTVTRQCYAVAVTDSMPHRIPVAKAGKVSSVVNVYKPILDPILDPKLLSFKSPTWAADLLPLRIHMSVYRPVNGPFD